MKVECRMYFHFTSRVQLPTGIRRSRLVRCFIPSRSSTARLLYHSLQISCPEAYSRRRSANGSCLNSPPKYWQGIRRNATDRRISHATAIRHEIEITTASLVECCGTSSLGLAIASHLRIKATSQNPPRWRQKRHWHSRPPDPLLSSGVVTDALEERCLPQTP
jgi:hypothetical protein